MSTGKKAKKKKVYDKKTNTITYECSRCGAKNCKLWRDYQTFLNHLELYCICCAGEDQKKDISDVDNQGRRRLAKDEEYMASRTDYRSDQIGWLVPAVPTAEMDTFWGYTSVPEDRCEWWYALPNYPEGREPKPVADNEPTTKEGNQS